MGSTKRWYWAIFRDDDIREPPDSNWIRGELVSQWFGTLSSAQREMRAKHDPDNHCIHGVLRGDE